MEWKITPGLTEYPAALEAMAARVVAIQRGEAEELVWLVEHPPLYTLGTSAKAGDVLQGNGDSLKSNFPQRNALLSKVLSKGQFDFKLSPLPTYESGRGGQVTYHGPGQRVVYLMLDLKKRAGAAGPDLRAYVKDLERWIIATLGAFGIEGFVREGRVGVWVDAQADVGSCVAEGELRSGRGQRSEGGVSPPSINSEAKIAALGVRVQKWVTSHGMALNVNPDLAHYAGIVPCGIRAFGVTSMHQMGVTAGMSEVDAVLRRTWDEVFGD